MNCQGARSDVKLFMSVRPIDASGIDAGRRRDLYDPMNSGCMSIQHVLYN